MHFFTLSSFCELARHFRVPAFVMFCIFSHPDVETFLCWRACGGCDIDGCVMMTTT